MNRLKLFGFLSVSVAALVANSPALATLGETLDSVQADATQLQSSATVNAQSAQAALFSVKQMTLPNGTLVNEYVSAAGMVFAVSWSGLRPPDLQQLLGDYFQEYQAVATQARQRSSRVQIDTGRMTYRAGGHMRSFSGVAEVPSLRPAGLADGAIQ